MQKQSARSGRCRDADIDAQPVAIFHENMSAAADGRLAVAFSHEARVGIGRV